MKYIAWFLLIGAIIIIVQQRHTISSQNDQIVKLLTEEAHEKAIAREKEINDAAAANAEARKKAIINEAQKANACDTPSEVLAQMLVDGQASPSRLKMVLKACEALPPHTDIRFLDDCWWDE